MARFSQAYLALDKSLIVAITYSNTSIFLYIQTNYSQITSLN